MATRGQYVPTTWNSGAAPGISAAELQKIEDQIAALDDAWLAGFSLDVGEQLFLNALSEADIRLGGDIAPVSDNGSNIGNAVQSFGRVYAYDLYDQNGARVLELDAARFWKSVLPGADGGYNLGNSSQSWGSIFAFNLLNEAGQTVWDLSGDMWPRGHITLAAAKSLVVQDGYVAVNDLAYTARLGVKSDASIVTASLYRATTNIFHSVLDVFSNVGGTRANKLVIRADGGVQNATGLYSTFSDERMKSNIRPSDRYGLAELRQLEVSEWEDNGDGRTMYGLVAQQVEPIMPWLVGKAELEQDGETVERLTVNHSLLPFVNTTAIQELADRVEALEAG